MNPVSPLVLCGCQFGSCNDVLYFEQVLVELEFVPFLRIQHTDPLECPGSDGPLVLALHI